MPVVAAVEGGRKLARRNGVSVAIQDVADLVRILLANAGQSKTRESFRGRSVESWNRTLAGRDSDGGKQQQNTDRNLPHARLIGADVTSLKPAAPQPVSGSTGSVHRRG